MRQTNHYAIPLRFAVPHPNCSISSEAEEPRLLERLIGIARRAKESFIAADEFIRGLLPLYGSYVNGEDGLNSFQMGMLGRGLLSSSGAGANLAGTGALAAAAVGAGTAPLGLGLLAIAGATNYVSYFV